MVEGDEHRVGAHLGDGAEARRAHADVVGLERHQRLVLHRPSQRDERSLVTDVLQPQPAVEAVEEVGRPFGGAAHLHEQRVPSSSVARKFREPPRPVVIGAEIGDREPGGGEAGGDGGRRRVLVGAPEREQRRHADGSADGEREEHLGRELDREHDAHGDERDEQERAGPSPP